MRQVHYIPQSMHTECGLCCIVMIAHFYKHYVSLAEIRDIVHPGRDGVSARQLCEAFAKIQFDHKVYKGELIGLEKMKMPVIAHLKQGHFIVVTKVSKEKVWVVDPAYGKGFYTRKAFTDNFSGIIISASPREDIVLKKRNRSSLSFYLKSLFSEKKILAVICLFAVISYGTSLLIPSLSQQMMDSSGQGMTDIFGLGCGILLAYVFAGLMNSLLNVVFKTEVFRDFYRKTFGKLIHSEIGFFENRSAGSILFGLNNIERLNEFFSGQMITVIISSGAFVLLLVFLGLTSGELLFSFVTIAVIYSALYAFVYRNVILINQTELSGKMKLQEMELELTSAIETLKAGNMENKGLELWKELFSKNTDISKRKGIIQAVLSTSLSLVNVVFPMFMLFLATTGSDKFGLSIGKTVSVYSISTMAIGQMTGILTSLCNIGISKSYFDRLQDIVSQKEEENGDKCINDIQQIELKNISFKYTPHSEEVLKNINITIKKGEKIAIVGASGSGKSTIGKLLSKLYKPTSGQILFDGVLAENIDNQSLRSLIELIPQHGVLFSKSIKNNLTLYNVNSSDEDIANVCKMMQIYDDIIDMPMKFETVLGENGDNLSGGQRQRLILARSILSKSPFVIFDESTSALDSVTEGKVFAKLREQNITQIVIAHRLSTIVDADRIYVLQNGEIVEEGTHNELLSQNGVYTKLYTGSLNI